jgi:D-alanine-D-alanine ligase
MSESGWVEVDKLVKDLRHISDRVAVLSVTNLKSKATYTQHSTETEYLAAEDDFIQAVLGGDIGKIGKLYKMVYNAAQSGAGPGRKALIPAFCQLHRIPTTSSDPYVVSLARQKFHFGLILQSLGLPVPPSWSFNWETGWLLDQKPSPGTKVILKPTYESASIGIDSSSAMTMSEKAESFLEDLSRRLSQPITVQTFIPGFEVEVPVVGLSRPFAPLAVGISLEGSQHLGEKFLTYDHVFTDNYGFYPFDHFASDIVGSIRNAAVEAYVALGVRGFGRVDFRVADDGKFYIMDVATNPHVIKHSSFAFTFSYCGRSYEDLLATLVALGCRREGWI